MSLRDFVGGVVGGGATARQPTQATAAAAKNVMGTVLPGVLSGHWRYAHINGVRGDGVNPGLPGMDGTVSEDAVRSR